MMQPLIIAAFLLLTAFGVPRLIRSHLGGHEPSPHANTSEMLRQDRLISQARKAEHLLCQVRQTQTPIKDKDLRPDWQFIALDGTNFEFALMLVTVVWGEHGKEFQTMRLNELRQNPMYWDLVDFIKGNKIEKA